MNTTIEALNNLTERQERLLMKVLVALLANDGELSEYHLEVSYKAGTPRQLEALVAKGVLVCRKGTMVMPVGPYKGNEMPQRFYSAA